MSSVGTVSIDLEARVAKLESDLGRAAMIADRKCKEIANTFKTLAVGVAGYFSGKAIIDWLQQSFDAADELSKMSQKVGISTETLSGWSLAAQQAGVDMQSLQTGLVKLAKAQDAAISGNKESAAAFAQIGISVKDLKSLDLESLFEKVSEAMSKYEDGGAKAAFATKLFGKAGADLIPLLNAGKKGLQEYAEIAKAYGLVVSGPAAKAAEDFNDTIERITKFLGKGVANQITAELGPALAELASQADKFFRSESWTQTLQAIATAAKWVAQNIDAIIGAVVTLTKVWAAFFTLNLVRQVTDWGFALLAASRAVDTAGVAVSGFAAITKASFANAVKNIGVFGVAFNVLGAAITGWEIGKYLSDQFLQVRLAGIALVDGLLVGWERIKQGADIAWAAIEYAFGLMGDDIKKKFADVVASLASGLDAIGAETASDKLNAYAKSLTSGASAGDKFAASVAAINTRTDAAIKNIHKTTDEMADFEIAAENAKKKASQPPKPPAAPKQSPFPGGIDINATKAAADAIQSLTDKIADLYAENLKTGDKVLDQQAQSLRQLAEQGAKAIEAGANVAQVQALVAKGAEQIALTAQKARDAENRQFDDYIKQQQQKLQDDKDALALKVASAGMSDKEIAQAQQLLDISKDTTAEMRKLVDARDKGSMSQDEFDRRSAAIKSLEDQRVQATLDANKAIDAANADWLNGAQRATKNFLDQAANVAQQTSDIITSAFSGFVDAFADLLTTGKADFKGFAISVLSDLAKMETRIAASKILSAVFGGSGSGGFGWGGVAMGDVFKSASGISALSGGVYNRPTHFFASGGNVLGEAGWEGVLPLKRTQSGKLGVMAEGGSAATNNVSVVVNIDNSGAGSTSAAGSDDQMRALGNMIASKCKEVITSEQRPGGILWRPAHA